MKKNNNKGFTLVELIATIVILSIILSIGAYSIIKIINSSSEKEYKLLVENIKDAAELYYQECKYGGIDDTESYECDKLADGVTLGKLVEFGYLTGNAKINEGEDKDEYTLVNPNTGEPITDCNIMITYDAINREVVVSTDEPDEIFDNITNEMRKNPCPTDDNYNGIFEE